MSIKKYQISVPADYHRSAITVLNTRIVKGAEPRALHITEKQAASLRSDGLDVLELEAGEPALPPSLTPPSETKAEREKRIAALNRADKEAAKKAEEKSAAKRKAISKDFEASQPVDSKKSTPTDQPATEVKQ